MNSKVKDIYQRIVFARPAFTLIVVVLIAGFFAWHTRHFKLDASSDSLLLEDDADLRYYQKVRKLYPSDDYLIVTYTPRDDLFTPEGVAQLEALVSELESLERVEKVFSALQAPLFRSPPIPILMLATGMRQPGTLADSKTDLEQARKEIVESPLYRDFLISADGKTTGMTISFATDAGYEELGHRRNDLRAKKYEYGLSDVEVTELADIEADYKRRSTEMAALWAGDVEKVRAVLKKHEQGAEIFLGGIPMIVADMISYVKKDLVVFGVGVLVFLVLTLGVIFRRVRWVLLPMLTCVTAGAVMIGFLGLVDWRATVISSNFTALLFIITMSMAIHLVVRYRELHQAQPEASHVSLVKQASSLVALPCFYCALTTMVGFGSLYVSGIRPVMDFGKMMSMGIGVAFVLVFTLLPTLLMFFPKGGGSRKQVSESSLTGLFARATEKQGGLILVAAAVMAILGGVGISRLTVENKFIDYFKDDTEIYRGMEVIDTQLGGTTPLEIIIDGEGDEYWFKPENLAKLRQIHTFLEEMPESGKVVSLDTMMRVAEQINDGKPIPSILLKQVRRVVPDDLKAEVLTPYVSPNFEQARIVVRVSESSPTLKREAFLGSIRHFLKDTMELPDDKVHVTGMYVLYNNMLQSLFTSQISTIGAVFLATWLMFLVLFRSFFLATIGIIPNAFPVIVVLGTLGWLGIPLDMMTITIAAITIGIAVDHTIHYIHRFKEEFPKDRDYIATMHRCHNSIGKAMYYTSITIIAGFSILALSNFIPTIYFGLFTGLAMTVALLAAMTLLPRLIILLKPLG